MISIVIIVCTLVITLAFITFYLARRKPDSFRGDVFFLLICNIAFSSLFAAIAGWLELSTTATGWLLFVQSISDHCYFVLHTFLAPLYCLYVMSVSRYSIKLHGKRLILFLIPLVFSELLVITNPITHWIFYFDSQVRFVRGSLEGLLYLAAFIYVALAVKEMIKCSKVLTRKNTIMLWYFFGFIIAGVIIQALFEQLKVELMFEMVAMLGFMLSVECEDGVLDSTSKAYNRRGYVEEINKLLDVSQEFSVITINMINFKLYKRMLGYKEMSKVVAMIVDWLQSLDNYLSIYRVSYNNFAIIYSYGSLEHTGPIVQKIKNQFQRGFDFQGKLLEINANIGMVRVPTDYDSPEVLLSIVEETSYRDTVGVRMMDAKDFQFLLRMTDVEAAIKRAIVNDTFEVYLQPIWGVEEKRFVSAEALLRLNDPQLGNISPDEFIPVAESCGLISEVGKIVLDKVCKYCSDERVKAMNLKTIEVNLSLYQIAVGKITNDFMDIVNKYGIKPSFINFEITESASHEGIKNSLGSIKQMMNTGFSFSLDDYGTGYSNLSFVSNLDFLNIKSDKALLWDSEKNDNAKIILEESIKMIRRLGKNVIQEGVETKEQLDFSIAIGANYIQGYYFSKPLKFEEFVSFINEAKNK